MYQVFSDTCLSSNKFEFFWNMAFKKDICMICKCFAVLSYYSYIILLQLLHVLQQIALTLHISTKSDSIVLKYSKVPVFISKFIVEMKLEL